MFISKENKMYTHLNKNFNLIAYELKKNKYMYNPDENEG